MGRDPCGHPLGVSHVVGAPCRNTHPDVRVRPPSSPGQRQHAGEVLPRRRYGRLPGLYLLRQAALSLLVLLLILTPSFSLGSSSSLVLQLDVRQLRQAEATTGFSHSADAAGGSSGPHPGNKYERPGSPQELTNCINNNQPNNNGTSWAAAMRDEFPYFRVVGMWWSSKPADVPLTITTQLSWNRKWQLKAMCRSWAGPIAAVMHMPVLLPKLTHRKNAQLSDVSNHTLQRAVEVVAAFHQRMDRSHPCKLDLMLLAEPYKDAKSLVMYPVNTMRNYARLMARTPLIGLVDVDLIVSANFRKELLDPAAAAKYIADADAAVAAVAAGRWGASYATGASRRSGVVEIADALNVTKRLDGPRAAYVLPAFATRGGPLEAQMERAEKLSAGTKAELLPYYRSGKIQRFDWGSNGHVNTKYEVWFNSSQPYLVEWSDRYEPWLFVDRLTSSWADARYRGYGKNKIIHIRTLAYEGYELRVHPEAFLIHRPHLQSSSSNAHLRSAMYGKKSKKSSMYGHNLYLYEAAQRDMALGKYRPAVDPATEACSRKLSWWAEAGGAAGN